MHLTSQLDFAADPASVAAMLIDPDFLERVCAASDATTHRVQVDGRHTVTSRTLLAPAAASKFTGEHVTVVEDVHWSEAGADGSYRGALAMSIAGLPVVMNGQATIGEGGRGTVVAYESELKVNIPFVGRKLEESAAPAVTAGIDLQQRVGDEWLAKKVSEDRAQ